jgi:hypothetical protein
MKGIGRTRSRLFTVVWEFRVPARQRRAFEKTYGPEGAWVQLFRTGEGYVRTELLRDLWALSHDRPLAVQAGFFRVQERTSGRILSPR